MQSHGIIAMKRRARFAFTRASLSVALSLALLTAAAPAAAHDGQSVRDVSPVRPVVLGTSEPNYKFPWVVTVSGTGALTGKGVLIAPTWVLTAAHLFSTFRSARVSYTRTDPVTGVSTNGEQQTAAGSVFIHPDYVVGQPYADLALVRLPTPFAADPYLQPAQLPTAAAAVGQEGTVAGNSHTGPLPPGHVAVLRAPILLAGGRTFIARSPKASLCPGDSGSGFVTKSGDLNVVTGIAAQGTVSDCATPNLEFEAVDVFQHLSWIQETSGVGIHYNAEIYATDGAGGINGLNEFSDWRSSWSIIVPGHFGGDSWSDLLFYDPTAGQGEFYTTDGAGHIALLRAQPDWRTTWDLIVPGNFGGDGHTDLLFYDRETGFAQFYATDGGGGIHLLREQPEWRTGWDLIVPGDFGGDGWTDLLFYDRETGFAQFYATDGGGGIHELRTHTNWNDGWDMILPGHFGGNDWTDLLFYDRETGQGLFVATNGSGGFYELQGHTNWRTSWDMIVPGHFGGNDWTDLLFYDRSAGWGEFYATDGAGGISQLRAFDNWRASWYLIVAQDFGGSSWTDLLFYER
jgi:hypothetical protein